MIEGLKPYPVYKTLDAKWLGDAPSHWQSMRIKNLLREMEERSGNGDGVLLSLTRDRGLIPQSLATSKLASAEDLSKYKVCHPGDLVMNRMQAWSGMFAVAELHGLVSPDYSVFRQSREGNVRYFQQLFKTPQFVAQFAIRSKGIGTGFNRLYTPDFGEVPLAVPPLDEQNLIVCFIDHIDRRVRRYIGAKRRLITLLNEQKQAITHRAVTRGLDPNVELHSSGVPWIGDVPNHWRLIPNRAFLRIRKTIVGSRHEGLRLLSLTKRGVIVRDMTLGGKHSNFWERCQEVRPGDFVFCFFDVEETPRTIGIAKDHGMTSSDYTVMECTNPLLASFVESFYKAMDDRKLLSPLYSGLRKRIPKPVFLSLVTPIPPPEEQEAIVRYIDASLVGIEISIDRLGRELNLITEYRTRLVADVVTGKLDVREAAALLTDNIEDHDLSAPSYDFSDDDKEIDDEDLDAVVEETEA